MKLPHHDDGTLNASTYPLPSLSLSLSLSLCMFQPANPSLFPHTINQLIHSFFLFNLSIFSFNYNILTTIFEKQKGCEIHRSVFLCLCVTDITSLKMNLNGMDFSVILISTISSHYFKVFYFLKIRNCYPLLLCHELILFRTSSGAIIIKREREREREREESSSKTSLGASRDSRTEGRKRGRKGKFLLVFGAIQMRWCRDRK